nr:EOG090X08NC [Lepidurus arcticus]
MVLESTMICVDNSEFMRNGDFLPTRLQAQQDAVNLVCHSKIRSNPENNVGLLTLSNTEVLSTLTTDAGRILTKLHSVQPVGHINLLSGIRIAHLALKHRQGKNHRTRIVVFVGSPVDVDEKELIKLAKKLKKEKVNVDVVSFGEEVVYLAGSEVLSQFVNTLNGKEGTGSHLVTIPPGPHLSDALISSPILQGEDGVPMGGLGTGGYEFGVDPNEDPELALALRVSMEEQRQRQEEEARRTQTAAGGEPVAAPAAATGSGAGAVGGAAPTSEEAMLEQALAMSMGGEDTVKSRTAAPVPDFASMTEEEQIAYAMQMSMQEQPFSVVDAVSSSFSSVRFFLAHVEPPLLKEDLDDVIHDPAFLQSVLENLPGVDPSSEAVRNAMGALAQQGNKDKDKKEEKK